MFALRKGVFCQFQLTRSRGAWRKDDTVRTAGENFNSHAHVERDSPQWDCLQFVFYFNSHAHVERDAYYRLKINYFVISTHTLTWSVTV